MEGLAGEDGDVEATVEDSLLQGARSAPLAHKKGRGLEGPREDFEFLRIRFVERIDILEDFDEEEGPVPTGHDVEAQAPGGLELGLVEPRSHEEHADSVEQALAAHHIS